MSPSLLSTIFNGKFRTRQKNEISNGTMTFKNIFLTSFLTVIILIFLFACGQDNSNKNVLQTDIIITKSQMLTIDTFSTFPPEIDGCSCYFSNDSTEFKNHKYIYANDYAETSFLKINGVITKFIQIDFKEIDSLNVIEKYKSDSFEMIIELKEGIQNGDETWLKTGTIKLTDKTGKTLTKKFYGECGC